MRTIIGALLSCFLVACGGSGGSPAMPDANKTLTLSTYDTGDAAKPVGALDAGGPIRISQFTATGNRYARFTESAYADAGRSIDVHVTYDATGVPVTVFNVKTKEQVAIKYGDNRIDFLFFDARGRYVSGTAVSVTGSKLSLANIVGAAVFTGQISASSDLASAALIATPAAELGTAVEAPAKVSAFFLQNLPMGGSLDLADRQTRTTVAVAGLLLAASAPGASPTCLLLCASGVGAIATTAFPALTNDTYVKAMTDIRDKFSESIALGRAHDETVQSAYKSLEASGSVGIGSAPSVASRSGDAVRDPLALLADATNLPAPTGGPTPLASTLGGVAVDQASVAYGMTGSITAAGELSVTGAVMGQTLLIRGNVVDNNFTGVFRGSTGIEGLLAGGVTPLGSCQKREVSAAGSGTFVKAFDMGKTAGTATFAYDAYTTSKVFQVWTKDVVTLRRGGPPAGTANFQLNGSRIVFVAVTASVMPSAWEFTLGCPP
jgi:hypothetical protein